MEEKITLYQLEYCPYCKRVRNKLDALGLEYETVNIPKEHDDRETVKQLTGETHVPVIVDKENNVDGMNQSDDIVQYLEETYG